jgi:hypothetical protein
VWEVAMAVVLLVILLLIAAIRTLWLAITVLLATVGGRVRYRLSIVHG